MKTLSELKVIANTGIKVLISGHVGLIKVTNDLLEESGTKGYALDYTTLDGNCQVYSRVYDLN